MIPSLLFVLLLQFPPAGDWPERLDPAYEAAVAFAMANASTADPNLEIAHYQSFGREPFGDGIGPFKERGPATGLIIRDGVVVAKWGGSGPRGHDLQRHQELPIRHRRAGL